MELTISTPALLFSTVSLLMIAFTNRFVALSSLIRSLHEKYQQSHDSIIVEQIKNLRLRVSLIRNMQVITVTSLLFCVICMFLLFFDIQALARWFFGFGLFGQTVALALSVWEITISTKALEVELSDMENKGRTLKDFFMKNDHK
ncbi:MAG: DUF2721 domain-containing protein [Pseudarcicella sp.]|jgi:hypothetical protein|nr:DUF2721 domain-containing protein [Pseudarcicella sp.]MBP6411014.1 DUF2721 domain-containing protein [Pseudarcicella sp.]